MTDTTVRVIKEGDTVMLSGGGLHRTVTAKPIGSFRLGRVGSVLLKSLIGLRYGEVVAFDEKTKCFKPSGEHPDLDRTEISADADEERDNRNLVDHFGASQQLSHAEVTALKAECGVEGLLGKLVESSTTFASKTAFSQEKYLRKKKVKYALLFKLDCVCPDNLAEMHIPTIKPSDQAPEEARCLRLRCDTIGLILHHSDIHSNATVVLYDKTNGVLPAAILNRLGDDGKMYHVMDKVNHPNVVVARSMHIPLLKERWRAVPRNSPFLTGEDVEATTSAVAVAAATQQEEESNAPPAVSPTASGAPTMPSQWVRGIVAREALLASPADSLVIADDENPLEAVVDLLPFLAQCGHLVVYSSFLDQLTEIFARIRNDCVCIQISETFYRHQQVLSNRTHPTVNMSTAGGYLLSAIKVETNMAPRPRYAVITDEGHAKYCVPVRVTGVKRAREDETAEEEQHTDKEKNEDE